ncbi:MAG: cupin domain-containing protein [Jatrophihabitans sp.]|uniref:cupin domain-containing protein n=1 Tax=Jatrophihabitans sp. TaxID=1932789 RepID=UPI00390ED94F
MSTSHFNTEAGGEPTSEGRFVDVSAIEPLEYVPGLQFQPVLGEKSLVNFVSFDPHTEAPMHVHAEEQVVVVTEGEFEFTIGEETRTMRVGDVAVIPSWVPHGAHTLDTPCKEIDMFSPPRATLLEHAEKQIQREVPPV